MHITPNHAIAGRVGKFGRCGILYPEIDGDFYREVLADLEHRSAPRGGCEVCGERWKMKIIGKQAASNALRSGDGFQPVL